ncbi:hypothetical protein Cflav_PD3163 [Pedosphaera parvula Ellin514]|uniref:Uncharacterized protein n=1 Tax=Pedosphaera parvula (strain Ellin514) TaxID=320771 RepID=B9XJ66_PEDPL|nr:hypothetical protein Cflav_PD3163 [Pedosphaera parvula Ellin514]
MPVVKLDCDEIQIKRILKNDKCLITSFFIRNLYCMNFVHGSY